MFSAQNPHSDVNSKFLPFSLLKKKMGWTQWFRSIIPATQESRLKDGNSRSA
jgi:hypothetical protein